MYAAAQNLLRRRQYFKLRKNRAKAVVQNVSVRTDCMRAHK